MKVYAFNPQTGDLGSMELEPPFNVQEDGSITLPGRPEKVYMEFSRSKKALIDHLVDRKAQLQQLITAARKLKRGDLSEAAPVDAPQPVV
jgi:hypothetical protein